MGGKREGGYRNSSFMTATLPILHAGSTQHSHVAPLQVALSIDLHTVWIIWVFLPTTISALAYLKNSTGQFRQRKSSGTSEVQRNIKGNPRSPQTIKSYWAISNLSTLFVSSTKKTICYRETNVSACIRDPLLVTVCFPKKFGSLTENPRWVWPKRWGPSIGSKNHTRHMRISQSFPSLLFSSPLFDFSSTGSFSRYCLIYIYIYTGS